MTILSYDQVINNRSKGTPLTIAEAPRKTNTLSSKSYKCYDLINFSSGTNRALLYGYNDSIYWIENTFNKSGKKYILYTLRSDGTLLIHDTNELLNPFDSTTYLNKSFGIVCNVYQSPIPLIPIDTLKNGYSFGLLFDSELKDLTGSNPGGQYGLSDPTNLDTFQRLTGRSSLPSMGAPSFLDRGSSRYPLYTNYIITTQAFSDNPEDYWKTRCNEAIEASRGSPDNGYSPIVGNLYNNANINMASTYLYGYMSYEEYKMNSNCIKGYTIYYKVVNYEGDPDQIKITPDGIYSINDNQTNYTASTLYIPLHAVGLLWLREYNTMINSGRSYDKIYEILTGSRRGGLNDPTVNIPKDPSQPVDIPDDTINNPPPPVITTNPPIDTDPNNPPDINDPQINPPPTVQDPGTTEQNNSDTSGDIGSNADITNTQDNANTDINYNINDLLAELGVDVREKGSAKITDLIKLTEQEPVEEKKECKDEIGVLVEDKGKIEIPVYEHCGSYKRIIKRSKYIYFKL